MTIVNQALPTHTEAFASARRARVYRTVYPWTNLVDRIVSIIKHIAEEL
jgi:hypothetical protein